MLREEFAVGHENQGIVGDRGPHPLFTFESLRQISGTRRRVGLENALLLAGGKSLYRPAEENVDLRITFFGEQSRQRLARGKANEIDMDAAGLLEGLQHR